jgi:5-formaminoimidazole-4-carboxamide-1-beta-D-ribofuranosyl 5'-monophosphate synthetase
MDLKDIVTKVAGNKDLMEKIKSADPKQAKELLDKAGIKVDASEVKDW